MKRVDVRNKKGIKEPPYRSTLYHHIDFKIKLYINVTILIDFPYYSIENDIFMTHLSKHVGGLEL